MLAVVRCHQTLGHAVLQSLVGIITIETRRVKCLPLVVVDLIQITLILKSCATKHVKVVKTSYLRILLIQVCKKCFFF